MLANGGDDGKITLKGLPAGYYLQVQEHAPGYVAYVNGICTPVTTVPIEQGTNNGDINYINRIADSTIKILQTDDSGAPISGGEYRIYNKVDGGKENTLYTLVATDEGWLAYNEAGDVISDFSLPNGTYYLEELNPPAGHAPISDVIKITVDNTKPEDSRVSIEPTDAGQVEYSTTEGKFIITLTNKLLEHFVIPTGVDLRFNILPLAALAVLGVGFYVTHRVGLKKKRRALRDE